MDFTFQFKNLFLHSVPEKTFFEKMYNGKPKLFFVKLFGCVASIHFEKPFRTKLDQTSKMDYFLEVRIIISAI